MAGDEFEDDYDPFAEDEASAQPVPLETLTRTPIAEDAFRAPQPAQMPDMMLGGAGNDRIAEDAFRPAKPAAVPGTTLDYSRAPQDSGADIPPPLDNPASEVRPVRGVSSQDHKANFRDLVQLNPEVFSDISTGVDPKNPAAISQFNQANFWGRVQAMQGGIEAFNRAPAPTKTAIINKFTDERMREIFPGYGRGQKMPPQVRQIRQMIYNDMRTATTLELNGIPKRKQNTVLGDTAEETIANVLKSPELDRTLLDELEPTARSKYINAYVRHIAGKDQKLASDMRFHLAPLLLDEDGANYDKYVSEVFPEKDADGNAAPAPQDDPNQTWGASVKGFLRGAKDLAVYTAGEVAKTPGYVSQLMATVPRKLTGKDASQIPGNKSYENFANWWTEGVSGIVEKGSSQQAIDRRAAQSEAKGKAVEESTGTLDAIGSYVKAMANDPQTSLEEISGMIAGALTSGGVGAATGKAVAKGAAKETVKTSAKVGAVSASAAYTSGQTQQDVYAQLVPQENTPAYELARARYGAGELSKARQAEAKAKGYDYDLDEDFKNWAQSSADAAGLVAGLVVLGTGGFGGSIESTIASGAKGKLTSQTAKTALVEGGSEALEEYGAAVAQGYYDRVRAEYKKTGDDDKLVRALADGQARIQAGIGFILGGATGAGFAVLHGVSKAKSPDELPPLPADTEPDPTGPAPTTDTTLSPEVAQALAAQARMPVQGSDGTYYVGATESPLRRSEAPAEAPDTSLDPALAQTLAVQRGQPAVGADGTVYAPPANIPDTSGLTGTVDTTLDPLTAQAVANAYGRSVRANDGTVYSPAPVPPTPQDAARAARREARGVEIGTTREQRSLEQQLAARDPAPLVPDMTVEEYAALVENDPKAAKLDAEVQSLVDERASLERQNKKLERASTPADIRQRNANSTRIEEITDQISEKTSELDAYTKTGGVYAKVMVREDDGSPTGVKMDRVEFDELQRKQKQTKADSDAQAMLADVLRDGKDDPAAIIVALEAQKKTLATVVATDLNATRGAKLQILNSRLNALQEKVNTEERFLTELEAKRKSNAEAAVSGAFMKSKANAQKRLREAKKKLDETQAEIDQINDTNDYTANTAKNTEEYKGRLAAIDDQIKTQKDFLKQLDEQADAAANKADEILEDFRQEEGFEADKLYTNRQSGLAQVPITDTSVRRVITRFSEAVRGVAGRPIEIVVLRTDADFKAIEVDQGALPNDSFTTLARLDENADGTARPTIYVNTRRIEDAEADGFERELISKAAVQFVIPSLARTDERFKIILANIARAAWQSSLGRRVERAVSDGFYANGVSPSREAFHLSYVAELLRTAPKDANGEYAIRRGFVYRAASAINNYLLRRWPRLARKLGLSDNIAYIGKINELFSRIVRVDDLGHLPADVAGDWTSLFVEGELNRQRREFINTARYSGGLGRVMQAMRDRFALSQAIEAQINKAERNLVKAPDGMTNEQVINRLNDALNAVDLRQRRTDNRVRAEAEPLINDFQAALRDAARASDESITEFTKKFDQYVQLLSIREMLSPGGDYYLSRVKLSKQARAQFEARFNELIEAQKTVHGVAERAELGRKARADIDRIVAVDTAGKPVQKMVYAGYDLSAVNAELGALERLTPSLMAGFNKVYPLFREVMDRGTQIKYESGEYDPLDIAFRGRKHFAYRGGQEIDASKGKELTDPDGRNLAGRKSTGTADRTFSAKGRKDLPKNSTVTAINELILAIDKSERAKTAEKLAFVTEVEPKLLARGQKGVVHTRSDPQLKDNVNFDFDYLDAPNEGSTKSVQYILPSGERTTITFAHEDVLNGLRQHSVDGAFWKTMAQVQGLFGSLYTTRNPAFVLAVQAPRDFIHNTFTIIAPRHGAKAAFDYAGHVVVNLPSVMRFAATSVDKREAYAASLPAKHPLRQYVEQGGWYGAHAQHSALDLAAQVKERGTIKTMLDALPAARYVAHLLETLPEAADNLFRVSYVAVAADPGTKNALPVDTAVSRAGKLMDFSSGSDVQRMIAPWFPFARAWTNGLYNLMFHDIWQGGAIPLREIDTVSGKRVALDMSKAYSQFKPGAMLGIMLTAGAMAAMAAAMRDPDDEPPSAEDLAGGMLIPGTNAKWPYQYGWNKVFGSLGALAVAVGDGTVTAEQAARAWGNVWLKEATPFGLQYVPTSEHAHWVRTMVSQLLNANAVGKIIGTPATGVDSFGRPIFGRQQGVPKPSTPDAYEALAGPEAADLTAYLTNQFGVISNIVDGAMRLASDNMTDEQKDKAVRRAVGVSSWAVGNYGAQEKINGEEAALGVEAYAADLAQAKRTPSKADDRALRKAPGGSSIEAYLKLDRRLGRQYNAARKKYLGKPEFSERMKKLNEKQAALRQKALARIRARQQQAEQ